MHCFSFDYYKCSYKNTMPVFFITAIKIFNPLESYNENKHFNRNSLYRKVFLNIETLPNGESHAPVVVLLLT